MAILTILALRTLGTKFNIPKSIDWKRLIRVSLPFGIVTFALGLSYKFDTLILNITRSDVETGYYNAAYNLVFSAVIISNVLNTSLFPSMTRKARSSPDSMGRIYDRTLRYLLILSIPIAVGAALLAEELVLFLFGPEYLPAVPALRIVIWVVPLMYLSEFLGYVLVVDNREKRVAKAVVFSSLLNVGLNLLLVPLIGFLAAAVLTVLTEAVLVTQYIWVLRQPLAHVKVLKIVLTPLIAAGIMGLVVAFTREEMHLLVVVFLGAITYGIALILLGGIGRDELRLIQSILRPDRTPAAVQE
jgi:O-antigen/teichoic acid export membrane protein